MAANPQLQPQRVQIAQVFPSAGTVPENLLRFHVFFNRPPPVDRLREAVRLVYDEDQPVPHAFLDLDQGLWDADGVRLTLLLHPGRIKSGLAAQQALGPALDRGRRYQLQLDLSLLNETPAPAPQWHRHAFQVRAPIDSTAEPAKWRLTLPPAASRDPLAIDFGRSMDRLGLEHGLHLVADNGVAIDFQLRIAAGEQLVFLTPSCPWAPQLFTLLVSPTLEDVAGNRPTEPFVARAPQTAKGRPPLLALGFKPL